MNRQTHYLVLVLLLLLPSCGLFAQETPQNSEKKNIGLFHLDTQFNTFQKNLKIGNYGAGLDVFFANRFYGGVNLRNELDILKQDNIKHSFRNTLIGVELGSYLCQDKEDALDLRLSVSVPIGSRSWKYFCYEAGIYKHCELKFIELILGAGCRYYDSYKANFKNQFAVFGSFGVGFTIKDPKTKR